MASARWFTEALAAQARVEAGARAIAVPTLWLIGGDDPIANPAVAERIARTVPGAEVHVLAGFKHEVWNERERATPLGQLRDFVWVDDAVAVMLWLGRHPEVSGLFNVGSGRARSFADLARAVFQAMGRAEAIEFVDMPEALRDRYQYYTCASLDRLRAAGCPLQTTSLEEGVRRYVQDHLEAHDPYR